MSRFSLVSRAFTLLLILVLLPLALGAAPLRTGATKPDATNQWTAETLPVTLWSWLFKVWEKNGCGLDPSGRCATLVQPTHPDNGCGLDPHGTCASVVQPVLTGNGCGLAPNGRCDS